MDATYPVIPATFANQGNPLLFGASALFAPCLNLPLFSNDILSLDDLKGKTLIGYIVGGIASSVPNTINQEDTIASNLIFNVFLTPK